MHVTCTCLAHDHHHGGLGARRRHHVQVDPACRALKLTISAWAFTAQLQCVGLREISRRQLPWVYGNATQHHHLCPAWVIAWPRDHCNSISSSSVDTADDSQQVQALPVAVQGVQHRLCVVIVRMVALHCQLLHMYV